MAKTADAPEAGSSASAQPSAAAAKADAKKIKLQLKKMWDRQVLSVPCARNT